MVRDSYCISEALTDRIGSPGSSLAMYQFVVTWATLLPLFDIVPVENKERQMMNGVTSTMDGPFMVCVRTL